MEHQRGTRPARCATALVLALFIAVGVLWHCPLAYSEPLSILWTQRLGGISNDALTVVKACSDGGCIVGGNTMSGVSGNKTSPINGGQDWWVVRLAANGAIMWDRTFGGAHNPSFPDVAAYDNLNAIVPAADGGFLLVGGTTDSVGGTKTASLHGTWDMYAVKINSQGDQIWDKTFGSSAIDGAAGACATTDGGFVLVGYTERSGNRDVWVVKLDSAGAQVWEHSYGGTNMDQGIAIVQRPDGGYIVAANSASKPSGDKTSPFFGGGGGFSDSSGDFWILWLDSQGVKTAEQSFGGTYDETVAALGLTPDAGLLIAGTSVSPASGNKTSPGLGWADGWFLRLDSTGTKLWDQSSGGPWWDSVASLKVLRDGGFLLGGTTNANPVVARYHAGGVTVWHQTNGLAFRETVTSMDQAPNGDFFFAGTDWPGPGSFGGADLIVTKTSPEPPLLSTSSTADTLLTKGFMLNALSAPGTCVPEWSTNLIQWFPLSTNVSDGLLYQVTDWDATNSPRRFYRVRRL
ncbi:MAG TPA: hypothetical protein VN673_16290 [Clostridia bacterium]|nr:hypothetical protein [Clostridia bacterium]